LSGLDTAIARPIGHELGAESRSQELPHRRWGHNWRITQIVASEANLLGLGLTHDLSRGEDQVDIGRKLASYPFWGRCDIRVAS
jgi:hypothetical protein